MPIRRGGFQTRPVLFKMRIAWVEPLLLTQVLSVVPAGIAGTYSPWRAGQIHLPVFWIPVIPAGMTTVSTTLGSSTRIFALQAAPSGL